MTVIGEHMQVQRRPERRSALRSSVSLEQHLARGHAVRPQQCGPYLHDRALMYHKEVLMKCDMCQRLTQTAAYQVSALVGGFA